MTDQNKVNYLIIVNGVIGANNNKMAKRVAKYSQVQTQKLALQSQKTSPGRKSKLVHSSSARKPSVTITKLDVKDKKIKNKSFNVNGSPLLSSTKLSSSVELMLSSKNCFHNEDRIDSVRTQISKSTLISSALKPQKQIKPHVVYKTHPFLNSSKKNSHKSKKTNK